MFGQFWSVRLAPQQNSDEPPQEIVEAPSIDRRSLIRDTEEKMEEKVYQIWSVLSSFEESSAACISDMLLHVSNGAYIEGVFVAEKFIWHVEILFGSADGLDARLSKLAPKGKYPFPNISGRGLIVDRTFVLKGSKVALQENRGIF